MESCMDDVTRKRVERIATRTIISYNVMMNDICRTERMEKIVEALIAASPDVIMLQEVLDVCMHIFVSKLTAGSYVSSAVCEKGVQANRYDTMIFTKKSVSVWVVDRLKFKMSHMERGLMMVCEVLSPGRGCVVYATTHLDSFQSPQFSAIRKAEIDVIRKEMECHDHVVIGMDSNTTDTISMAPDMLDIWHDDALMRPDDCMTWFSDRYFRDSPVQQKRYDRMLVKGVIVLNKEIMSWPWSDHAPITCTVAIPYDELSDLGDYTT